ncbi:MAG: ATP-binding protein [Candidatus Methanoplasma sp.]|jgi:AAA+ ATPase superfamily predicted ATPase|nr:ATP-binding protein [Candidatus Methanoplasma sp.]
MRFYAREEELEALERIRERSERSSAFTVLLGRRRVGKTALMVRSAEGRRSVYLFVSRVAEPLLCEKMQKAAMEAGIEIAGSATRFRDLLKALMISSRSDPITVMIDEFQDLAHVNPAIYGEIQKIWDLYRDSSRINLIVSGSVHSMMTKLFEGAGEPLFGRATSKIEVRPFAIGTLKEILADHGGGGSPEDAVALYMLTGGVPEYVRALMDSGCRTAEDMVERAISADSVFLRDGRDLLVSEFGRDYRTYFSILQLIAGGRNRRSEISAALGVDSGAYLRKLEAEHSLIRQSRPVFSERGGRNARWRISDMYLRFYFRFVLPNSDYVESGRLDLLARAVREGLDEYMGRALEDYFRQRIAEEETYTEIGGYWSRDGSVEIDAIVLNGFDGTADVIEIKKSRDRLDMRALAAKAEALGSLLDGYEVRLRGLSMDDA